MNKIDTLRQQVIDNQASKPGFDVFDSILAYNGETGIFSWKICIAGQKLGSPAGNLNDEGYIRIGFNKKKYYSHRIAWLLTHGNFPKEEIDHINGDRSDNRIANLRSVSKHENSINRRLKPDNKTKINGLRKKGRKIEVSIGVNGYKQYLGLADDFFEACCIRKAAENKYDYHDNHGIKI